MSKEWVPYITLFFCSYKKEVPIEILLVEYVSGLGGSLQIEWGSLKFFINLWANINHCLQRYDSERVLLSQIGTQELVNFKDLY